MYLSLQKPHSRYIFLRSGLSAGRKVACDINRGDLHRCLPFTPIAQLLGSFALRPERRCRVLQVLAASHLRVPARRLRTHHLEHVGALDVRRGLERGLGNAAVSTVLFLLRDRRRHLRRNRQLCYEYAGHTDHRLHPARSSGFCWRMRCSIPDRAILFGFLIPIKVKWFVMIIGAHVFHECFRSVNTGVSEFAHLGALLFGLYFHEDAGPAVSISAVRFAVLQGMEAAARQEEVPGVPSKTGVRPRPLA